MIMTIMKAFVYLFIYAQTSSLCGFHTRGTERGKVEGSGAETQPPTDYRFGFLKVFDKLRR